MKPKSSVVVVTGASSGIGRATALRFARAGASVVLAARRREALEAVAAECEAKGGQALAVPTDVSDAAAVDALAHAAVERFGRIDVWVNCAAVSAFAPFQDIPLEDFRRILEVNVMGYVHGARAALPVMRTQGHGRLVIISSIVGAVPQPYTHAYSMSKAAVRALGASLREELLLDGVSDVHVSTVLPPTIDTPFFQHAANYTGRRARAMPPVYPPEEVAAVVVGLVRKPRREVVVGRLGRSVVRQSYRAPAVAEKQMALQVETTHLSPTEAQTPTKGNLYEPAPGPGSVTGGWHGKRKTAVRRVVGLAALGGGVVAGRRWLDSTDAGGRVKKAAEALVTSGRTPHARS